MLIAHYLSLDRPISAYNTNDANPLALYAVLFMSSVIINEELRHEAREFGAG